MISILPALSGAFSRWPRREMPGISVGISDAVNSDMDCLPNQREIERERRAFALAALYPNVTRVFLDDALRHRKPKPRASILALRGCCLRREKWIVNSLDMFLRNAGPRVRYAHAH